MGIGVARSFLDLQQITQSCLDQKAWQLAHVFRAVCRREWLGACIDHAMIAHIIVLAALA
jgi:hypothetical protein